MKVCYKVIALIALNACMSVTMASASKEKHKSGGDNAKSHAPHWSYGGAEGPEFWGSLSSDFVECKQGKRQSPINLDPAVAKKNRLYSLKTSYRPVTLNVKNNGHTLQVDYDSETAKEKVLFGGKEHEISMPPVFDSSLTFGGSEYKLLQLHFHSPSEHAKSNNRYPLEVHLVHQNKNKNLAVIGVFFEKGAPNMTFQSILNNAPQNVGKNVVKGLKVNAADLLPEDKAFIHYSGSLTTPPCSENVNWYVMKKPLSISTAQMQEFLDIVGENARPLQDINWRSQYQTRK